MILVFLVMSACFSSAQTQSGSGSGIEGVITFSPTQPGPISADAPSSAPLANTAFIVENDKGAEVASFTTDDRGRFRIALAPGHYTVSKKGRKSIGKFGPFAVDVRADQMTSVTWECDTGIR
jgi:hypothetical protein